MEIKKGRCCVYGIEYHIAWCTKYRHKVLIPKIEKRLHELLNNFASMNDFEIISMNGEEDHIHLLVSATPNTVIPNIIKGMKGITAKMLSVDLGLNSDAVVQSSERTYWALYRIHEVDSPLS